ncbi:hypothetical protein Tco_1233132, partial [Tanacetum coccineum]
MAGRFGVLWDIAKNTPRFDSHQMAGSTGGLVSAAAVAASLPFAYRPLFGVDGRRLASCDAGPTSPVFTEDYLTSIRTASETIFRLSYCNICPSFATKVEDDDNDFLPDDERHVDLVVPFKKSLKQIMSNVPKSALRKSNRGMPFYTYTFCVGRTTFRGHFLGVAASWLVQVGIECYRCV